MAREKLVLAFGDSLTAGYGLAAGQSFPAQLQSSLRKQGLSVRVHNAGVSGETTAASRARLNWVLASLKVKPDLVILELGANDMLRGLPPAQARANLDAMLTELNKRKVPVLPPSPPPPPPQAAKAATATASKPSAPTSLGAWRCIRTRAPRSTPARVPVAR